MQSFLLHSSLVPSDRDASEQGTAGKGQCLRNLPSGQPIPEWRIDRPGSFPLRSLLYTFLCSAGTFAMFFSDAVAEYMSLYNAL